MPNHWYVHLQGETLGPLAEAKLISMLSQNRVQFADFAWREGFTKWVRIIELDEFTTLLPAYPTGGVPGPVEIKADPPTPTPKKTPKPVSPSRYLRVNFHGKIITESHGSFEIINIAERGVFVRGKAAPDLGTEIKFTLETDAFEMRLQMTGIVVRHGLDQEDPGFAVEFVRLNPMHKNLLEQYVRKNSE